MKDLLDTCARGPYSFSDCEIHVPCVAWGSSDMCYDVTKAYVMHGGVRLEECGGIEMYFSGGLGLRDFEDAAHEYDNYNVIGYLYPDKRAVFNAKLLRPKA